MLALLPLLASIEERNLALKSRGDAPRSLSDIHSRIARWLDGGAKDRQEADLLRASLGEIQPEMHAGAAQPD